MSKIKLFIADNSPVIQKRLELILRELAGFDVIGVAETVEEAIVGVGALRPDMMILDMAMPGGSGYDVLQAITKAPPVPLVIVLTNYPDYRANCLKAGADYFFDKSSEFEQFLKLLSRLARDSGVDS